MSACPRVNATRLRQSVDLEEVERDFFEPGDFQSRAHLRQERKPKGRTKTNVERGKKELSTGPTGGLVREGGGV